MLGFVVSKKTDELDRQSIYSDNHSYDNTNIRKSISILHEPHISSRHKQCSYVAIIILSLCIFVWTVFLLIIEYD